MCVCSLTMNVKRIIHLFNTSNEIYDFGGWEVRCHQREKIQTYLKAKDTVESTNYEDGYNKAVDKDEFYKYVVLFYEGGIFVRYENTAEIKYVELENLVKYCEKRDISLFQCPSVLLVGFIHHPQILNMLSEPVFHPINMLFRKINETVGHKTLVTSLPLLAYLDKIKADIQDAAKPQFVYATGVPTPEYNKDLITVNYLPYDSLKKEEVKIQKPNDSMFHVFTFACGVLAGFILGKLD